MFIEELDSDLICETFLIKDDPEFNLKIAIHNCWILIKKLSKFIITPVILMRVLRLLLRINIFRIISSNQALYTCRDNSVIPYLLSIIFENKKYVIFQNSIRFDYDLFTLRDELSLLNIHSRNIKNIAFHCWTINCAERLKNIFTDGNQFIVDGSYRFNYWRGNISGEVKSGGKYDAVLISSFKGICEDRLPVIRKFISEPLLYDGYNVANDAMTRIFLKACRSERLSIAVLCRNEHPEDEIKFYIKHGFKMEEILRHGPDAKRFDSYDGILGSMVAVGLGTSLLVEAKEFIGVRIIAFDVAKKHVFTPPTIPEENIISLKNEAKASEEFLAEIRKCFIKK